jgi:hypothetical protein
VSVSREGSNPRFLILFVIPCPNRVHKPTPCASVYWDRKNPEGDLSVSSTLSLLAKIREVSQPAGKRIRVFSCLVSYIL